MGLFDYDEFKWQLTHRYDDEGWAHQENKMVFNLMELDEAMRKTPTIDPVKHGHWNYKPIFPTDTENSPTYHIGHLVCSVCGASHANALPANFCGNCGAKMTGESDE